MIETIIKNLICSLLAFIGGFFCLIAGYGMKEYKEDRFPVVASLIIGYSLITISLVGMEVL